MLVNGAGINSNAPYRDVIEDVSTLAGLRKRTNALTHFITRRRNTECEETHIRVLHALLPQYGADARARAPAHVQLEVGNGILVELEAVGLQFEPYRWRPCGVTWA